MLADFDAEPAFYLREEGRGKGMEICPMEGSLQA
jgi:hypothetical protein